jgi:predicted nucleic acid-binding Zn ribbon protein
MSTGKKDDIQSVGQAIRNMLNSYRLDTKFDEANIIGSWERIVGKPIARRTRKLSIRNSVLFVEFDSPTMRRDFSFHKEHILKLFKTEFGPGVITEIVAM